MKRPALLAAVVLVVQACGPSTPSGFAAPTVSSDVVASAPASPDGSVGRPSSDPSPSLSGSVAPGTFAWTTVNGFELATLDVPRDYSDPSGPTITLSLIKRRASGDHRIGTLLVNPGGPGGSGIDMVRQIEAGGLPTAVLDSFDIVGWDPRGVGQSAGLRCPDKATVLRLEAIDPAPTTAAGYEAVIDMWGAMAAQCAAVAGPLLPFLSTDDIARDMDRIRGALGEERISYYGESYGTYLGARYATLFPDHLRAAVLDGPIDPGLDFLGRDVAQARGFESALDHFFAACKTDKGCAFHGGGDPAAAFDALMVRIRRAPLKTSGPVPLGPGQAWFAVIDLLYPQTFDPLANALAAAEKGDGDALLKAADDATGPDQPGGWGSYLATGCLDVPMPTDAAAIESTYRALLKTAPRIGAFMALDFSCLAWPARYVPLPPTKGIGLPPILILASTGDPATPYQEAAKLASALGSGVVLTRDGIGHTSSGGGSYTCMAQAVQHYLVDLLPPPPGTVCPDAYLFSK